MSIRLSHSASSCFQECPTKYKYRYKDRLYSKTTTGALLFGTALDKAIEVLLTTRDYDKSLIKFNEYWFEQEINGKKERLMTSPNIVYAISDYDQDLLSQDDIEDLYLTFNPDGKEDPKTILETLKSICKQREVIGIENLTKERRMLLNQSLWLILNNKAWLMIEAFKDKILPQIEEVLSIQEKVELENEDSDELVGYVDFVVRWKGLDTPVIFDLKTSAREYEEDSVTKSPQLTLYTYCLGEKYGTNRAGFLVLNKQIRKNKTKICPKCGHCGTGTNFRKCNNEIDGERCNTDWNETISPEVYVQILIDKIPERLQEIVMDNFNNVVLSIKNNIFTRSFGSCVARYGKCDYYDVCYDNKLDKVVHLEKKEKI